MSSISISHPHHFHLAPCFVELLPFQPTREKPVSWKRCPQDMGSAKRWLCFTKLGQLLPRLQRAEKSGRLSLFPVLSSNWRPWLRIVALWCQNRMLCLSGGAGAETRDSQICYKVIGAVFLPASTKHPQPHNVRVSTQYARSVGTKYIRIKDHRSQDTDWSPCVATKKSSSHQPISDWSHWLWLLSYWIMGKSENWIMGIFCVFIIQRIG